jgi:uncharacterized protein YndB with AHSA1/START domain
MCQPSEASTALQLTRLIKAPRDRVWTAWTDLDKMKKWSGGDGVETLAWNLDARVGGQWQWDLPILTGETMTAHGEYRELRPGEKLVYTWQWADDPQWENHESLVTIEFREKDAATTELRLTHENFPSEESRNNHLAGWNGALDKLERLLAN